MLPLCVCDMTRYVWHDSSRVTWLLMCHVRSHAVRGWEATNCSCLPCSHCVGGDMTHYVWYDSLYVMCRAHEKPRTAHAIHVPIVWGGHDSLRVTWLLMCHASHAWEATNCSCLSCSHCVWGTWLVSCGGDMNVSCIVHETYIYKRIYIYVYIYIYI